MDIVKSKYPIQAHKISKLINKKTIDFITSFFIKDTENIDTPSIKSPEYLENVPNLILAGGSITSIFTGNEKVNDLDIYTKYPIDTESLVKFSISKDKKDKEIKKDLQISSINFYLRSICIKRKNLPMIQIITNPNFIGLTIEELFEVFDYTCCMGAYNLDNLDNEDFILHQDFILHNSMRKLYFNGNTKYPIISLYRSIKYKDKGYIIDFPNIIKLALSIRKLKLETIADFKEQILGVDTLFLKPFIEYLDKMMNTDSLEFTEETQKKLFLVIDEIFERAYSEN